MRRRDDQGDSHSRELRSNPRIAIVELLNSARAASARSGQRGDDRYLLGNWTTNCGVGSKRGSSERDTHGEELIEQLASDLTGQFGRGFGAVNHHSNECAFLPRLGRVADFSDTV